MKFSLTLLPAILGAALAVPAAEIQSRQIEQVTLFFQGAGDAGYSVTVPTNGTPVSISAYYSSP